MISTETPTNIKLAKEADENILFSTLMLAFSADPMVRWAMPDTYTYTQFFPEFARAFAGSAFSLGTAYYTEGYSGAALWLPPSVEPDYEKMIGLIEKIAPEERKEAIFEINELMTQFHPDEPCWYLPLIGVDPGHQRKGLGQALMIQALVDCDSEGKIAYLESSNPKNISLYERFGFKVIGTIQKGSSPTMYPMIREARK